MDVLGLVLLLLTGLVVGIMILATTLAHLLTHPPRRAYAYAIARNLPSSPSELRFLDGAGTEHHGATFQEWTFQSRGVTLGVWDLAGTNRDGPCIIVTHGWGDSRLVSLTRMPVLLRYASRVILWDMPGHGDAPRSSTCALGVEEVDDLVALCDAVGSTTPVVLYGHSLGGGVSIAAGARMGPPRVAGVISEAAYRFPITPARNVLRLARHPYRLPLPLALMWVGIRRGRSLLWWRERPRSAFDRAAIAQTLPVPLLVLHGDADAVCPIGDAQATAEAAPDAELRVIPGGGHVDLFTDDRFRPQVEAAIAGWLRTLGRADAPNPESRAHN